MCGIDDDGIPLDTPINLLSEQVFELTVENRELQERNGTLQARLAEIRLQLQANKKLIKESDDHKETLMKKNTDLEKELLATKVYFIYVYSAVFCIRQSFIHY